MTCAMPMQCSINSATKSLSWLQVLAFIFNLHFKYIWVIDQACSVKMTGYWPSSFFFFACLWTETKSRSINTQKKKEANVQPSRPNKLGQ